MDGAPRELALAREQFLETATPDARRGFRGTRSAPRSPTPGSRSRRAGVDATRLTLPYRPDLDLGGILSSCAVPVLDHLAEQLSGSLVAVVLTAADGAVLDRRVGSGELQRRLDDISLAPGFSYAEEFAGTNGVGTALQGGAATLVVGAEHFADHLQPFACAGAPVRHPVDRRVVGLVDLTCLRDQATDLLRVLALQAARDIGLVMRERGSQGARALMAEFQAICARSPHAVVAVGEDVLIANRTAQSVLAGTDHEQLRARAADHVRARAPHHLVLEGGAVAVRPTTVSRAGLPVGVVLEIVPEAGPVPAPGRERPVRPGRAAAGGGLPPGPAGRAADGPRGLAGLAGGSRSWRATGAALRAAAAAALPTLVLGETGTGKAAAVRAAHAEGRAGACWFVADGRRDAPREADGPPPRSLVDVLAEVETRPDEPATVVVRHLEELDDTGVDALGALLLGVPTAPRWVVGVVTGETVEPDRPVAALVGAFATTVVAAPLRHRPEDVPALAAAVLGRLAPGRGARCGPETEQLLAGGLWPGNVTELAEVLRHALARRPTGDLQPADLPAEFAVHGTRRRLSPWESAERDLIVRALREAGGNRSRAAAALGMGRATLYRRLRAFGIGGVGRRGDTGTPDAPGSGGGGPLSVRAPSATAGSSGPPPA